MLAIGIIGLLLGAIIVVFSQISVTTPRKKNEPTVMNTEKKPDGADSLSNQSTFNTGELFRIEFALREGPTGAVTIDGISIYTNITDPVGTVTKRYVMVAPNEEKTRWETNLGDWNGTGIINRTGIHMMKIFTEGLPYHFVRFTVKTINITEARTDYPNSSLYYPGIVTSTVGFALVAIGVLVPRRRTRRAKLAQ